MKKITIKLLQWCVRKWFHDDYVLWTRAALVSHVQNFQFQAVREYMVKNNTIKCACGELGKNPSGTPLGSKWNCDKCLNEQHDLVKELIDGKWRDGKHSYPDAERKKLMFERIATIDGVPPVYELHVGSDIESDFTITLDSDEHSRVTFNMASGIYGS